jgi:hypothetical protein
MNLNLEKIKKVNGNTLKLVACITMLIDHYAAGVFAPIVSHGLYNGNMDIEQINHYYRFLRMVGRTAFPIFAFLLVEGFFHTKSRLKYALNILIFGLISEIPFDLFFFAKEDVFNANMLEAAIANKHLLLDQCNVYFTLLFGLLVIWGIESIKNYLDKKEAFPRLYIVFSIPVICLGCLVAYKLNTDYDLYGVILITIFYFLRKFNVINLITGYLFISNLSIEYASFPGFILMLLYSGKRGRKIGKLKYIFYVYYPLHITILYLVRCYIGTR